jgi:diguanylate cyclase (GGDEF)-like protein
LNLLDTPPEERFDRLTRLAGRLFGVPIAQIGLVDTDRVCVKSSFGLDPGETPRDLSFCGHAILDDDILVVPDTRLDERFHDNPLVAGEPHVRFYAGCPLGLSDGSRLGTLCLISPTPRDLNEVDRRLLHDLARMVEQEIAALHRATVCELTLLSNRRGFLALGRQALSVCARCNIPATISYIDLDSFTFINNRLGPKEGERALADFCSMLSRTFRDSDVIGRLGGDEFAVLMTNSSEEDSQVALRRLHRLVEVHNRTKRRGCEIGFSAGVLAVDATRHASIEALLGDAEVLRYVRRRQKHGALPVPAGDALRANQR